MYMYWFHYNHVHKIMQVSDHTQRLGTMIVVSGLREDVSGLKTTVFQLQLLGAGASIQQQPTSRETKYRVSDESNGAMLDWRQPIVS